jgi:hypothetical protein
VSRRCVRVHDSAWGIVLAVVMVTSAYGCAKPHLYPICFYQSPPTADRLSNYYAPGFVSAVNTVISDDQRADAVVAPDGRWLVAKVTKRENSRLATVWPRLGCLGDATDSNSTRKQADCVKYLQFFVATRSYMSFGNARDAGGFDIWNESAVPGTLVRCHPVRQGDPN